ncbi:hypothetical protein [Herbaspirillum rubrisubalbicans]|uniref:hypothetical protein n=1 Tax=Herbaspirillum rubrisubalbicans TaxID=80842 RepID=UPI0013DDDD08|nr:hypothetical protein [Herbaspirillum rubrisubalbicans]
MAKLCTEHERAWVPVRSIIALAGKIASILRAFPFIPGQIGIVREKKTASKDAVHFVDLPLHPFTSQCASVQLSTIVTARERRKLHLRPARTIWSQA